MDTVTRTHLAETIYAQVGLSRNESASLLESVLAKVAAVLPAREIALAVGPCFSPVSRKTTPNKWKQAAGCY